MKKMRSWLERRDILCLLLLSLVFLSFSSTSSFEADNYKTPGNYEFNKISIEEQVDTALANLENVGISTGLSKATIAIIAAAVSVEVGIPSNLPEKPLFRQLPNH